MRQIAKGIVREYQDIDDLIGDACRNLARARPEIADPDDEDGVRAYLSVVLYQAFYKQREIAGKQKRQAESVCSIDHVAPEQLPFVRPNQEHAAELGEVWRTLAALPRNWARAVMLAAEGADVSEIAREMGCRRNSVYIWLANGRRVLGDPDLLGTRLTSDSVLSRGPAIVTRRGATGYTTA